MKTYIVTTGKETTKCGLLVFIAATIYRRLRGWSKPRIIGCYKNV